MEPRDFREACLVLNSVSGVGPVLMRRLMDIFGDPQSILQADREALLQVSGVGEELAAAILRWREKFNLERELLLMQKHHVRFMLKADSEYPANLKELYDAPFGLYVRGTIALQSPSIAIVGTRRATIYGQSTARRFAQVLARAGCLIVSGMALGIDTEAHQGALEVQGRTAAVLGCGLDVVFPPANVALHRSLGQEGALLSEFSFGRPADRQTFPQRNRIVSGMADATLVVETDIKGGSLITARFAADQGRSVYAVPGRIDQETSRGCHRLIREGATLVTAPEEILEELRYRQLDLNFSLKAQQSETVAVKSLAELDPDERRIVQCFQGGAILHADSIAEQTALPQTSIFSVLMMLELKQILAKRADGSYELL
ncbi:MAG: DNA-processing protein DprA [Opitutales bacterium]|nr:DNA-processing protein DprA [Opitutales bacterium]